MDKTQYMLDNFKRAFPTRAARLEREWEAKQVKCVESVPITPKIDWTKPLTCNNSAVTNIEYLHRVLVNNTWYHVCKLTYRQGYTYYTLYDDYGRTAGSNAGTINVRNKAEVVTRHYAISKATGDVVATADYKTDAEGIAFAKGYTHNDLTFTSHTFTR